MSNSVVPAAAVAHAKQLVRNKKLVKRTEDQKPAQDEQQAADQHRDAANVVQAEQAQHHSSSMSDTTISGDFSFSGALAAAAESSASLTTMAQDDSGSMSDDGDGAGGTILLVGAVGLVGLGVAVLAGGGGGDRNDAPTVSAATQTVTTKEDTAVTGTVSATDPDGDTLTYAVSTAATKGTASIDATGKFTYTPNKDFNGTDTFTVTVKDPEGLSVTQQVTVTVTPVNDTLTAAAKQDLKVNEDTALTGAVGATDVDGPITYTINTAPTKGTATVGADGKFTFTPNANFSGTDSFVIKATEGGESVLQTINVTVDPVNDAPVVNAATTKAITIEAGSSTKFVIDATDPDGDAITATLSDTPDKGTIDLATNTLTVPAGTAAGTDSFTVKLSDGKGGNTEYTVAVTITAPTVNTISIDVKGADANTPATITATSKADVFTDNATVATDVIINGFGANDKIAITGKASDYSFGTSGTDSKDILITFTGGAADNIILLNDVLPANFAGIIFNEASAEAALGTALGVANPNFITFG